MRMIFFVAALSAIALTAGPAWAARARALYNPATGNITVDAGDTVGVIMYFIMADDGHLSPGNARDMDGWATYVNYYEDSEYAGVSGDVIEWSNFEGFPLHSLYDGGNVVAPRAPVDALTFVIINNFIESDLNFGEIVVVPEPSGVLLACVSAAFALRLRRK